MGLIRRAEREDVSRIAEILVFAKRVNYRSIFQNDKALFGGLQVLTTAEEYLPHPERLETIWVYEDAFVKGFIGVEGEELTKLFVDPFFQGQGIGKRLVDFALEEKEVKFLWALEHNDKAIKFYQKHGFSLTEEREEVEGSGEYAVKLMRSR